MLVPGSANPLLLKSAAAAAGGYQISRSLRFNASDSAYCGRAPASAGNRKTWTWAGWVKRSGLGFQQALFSAGTPDTSDFFISFESDDALRIIQVGGVLTWKTTQVFRDVSAWAHFVISIDTTQATATNRIALHVNGVQVTTFSTQTTPAQNTDLSVNTAVAHGIGYRTASGGSTYCSLLLADIYFIDGQALTPSSFTETDATTGQLIPKAFSGSYGSQGWHLEFADNSSNTATTLGKDTSGNSNNWTPNNLSVTAGAGNDSLVDVPTNGSQTDTGVGGEVRGNYCTWNPLTPQWAGVTYGAGWGTLSNGNLDIATSGLSQAGRILGTFSMASGKWYWESTINSTDGMTIGIAAINSMPATNGYLGTDAKSFAYFSNGNKYTNSTQTAYGATYGSGDVIGVAFDADNGTLVFYKNGVSQGTAFTGLTAGPYVPGESYANRNTSANFGQRPFAYTAPSGFKALCTANLPAPLVTKPSTVMDVKLYTGNGSTQTISGLSFSPDLVWLKVRSAAVGHGLFDQVRGAGKALYSHATNAEYDYGTTSSGELYQFNSDGFNLGSFGVWNVSSQTSVAWTWDAGTTTVTNTQGSITSTVRANATAGVSVATWSGVNGANGTIGHGLGAAPQMAILKNRGTADNWRVYHVSVGATGFLQLASTGATVTSDEFQNTSPTSTVFYLRGNTWNAASNNYVGYFFAPVAGYSNGFSYTGNGSADGVFVYLGMRPKLLLIKRTNTTGNWYLWDTVRNTYNVVGEELYPNLSSAAATATDLDILSNGFKMRSTAADFNASGGTYVGFAWAESPFNYSRAR